MKKALSILARLIISFILLAIIFRKIDSRQLITTVQHSDKILLFSAFALSSLNYILGLIRWNLLLQSAGFKLKLFRVIISFAGGNFFSLFLPSTVGGDFVRSVDLAMHTKKPRQVVATVILDRLSGFVGLVFFLLVMAIFCRNLVDRVVFWSIIVLSSLLAVALLVLFDNYIFGKVNALLHNPKIFHPGTSNFSRSVDKLRLSMKNLHQEIFYFKKHKAMLWKNLLLSLIIQMLGPFISYLIALSFPGVNKLNVVYFFLLMPIVGAISMLPLSIGGLGLRDYSTVAFFSRIGMSKDAAFAMSLINFFFVVVYALIGGVIYGLTVHHRRIQRN